RTRGDLDRRSVVVQLTDDGAKLVAEAPSLLQDRFHRELTKVPQWEQTMILATLQRIASMMDAEDIDAAPVLVPGGVTAGAEDVSRYLEKAVLAIDETGLAEEDPGNIEHDSTEQRDDAGNRPSSCLVVDGQ
ncbi:MAG TPA: MarR family winged helix-turn-helix transcriptional regulator, partial [Thermoguttaceae bacterium]|nr:MarR family winged helix-turn-helix transcriptional regulator [Thermoguttaceae bacterium]